MELTSRIERNDVLVIDLRVDNLDASNVREFKDTVQALIQQHVRVVLDMTDVKFVDSSGLGALLSCLRLLNAKQGDLRLCSLSGNVQALFELMRMQRVFNLQPTKADAVASFG